MSGSEKELDNQIKKFVNDLSHSEMYNRKHSIWMLARLAQKGNAEKIVKAGAVPKLAKCLEDDELIVRYRTVWALGLLAKHGQKQAVLDTGIESILKSMLDDKTQVEICHAQTGEIIFTTLGNLAGEALGHLN